jgi:hypothetical protein
MRVIVNGGRCEHETAELLDHGWESWESLGMSDGWFLECRAEAH